MIKKKKLSDKIVPEAVRDTFPDSQVCISIILVEKLLQKF